VASQNNKALRVVSSSGGVAGGSTPFTSVFTSRTPAGTNSTSAVSVDIPADGWSSVTGGISGVNTIGNSQHQSATRTVTGTASAQTFTGTAMDFAVQYVDVILATRN
jgi:hypothetical protein